MRTRYAPLFLLACLLSPCVAQAQDQPADDLSRQLFETYVARQVKINTSTIMSATHIVAERGRESGFWKVVLAELQKNNEQSELGCVRVLGKMLAIDGSARDVIRRQKETGEISAWAASVQLGPEVVTELIKRGQKADRNRIDHYTIALARARVPEARKFFESILRRDVALANPTVAAFPKQQSAPQPDTTTAGASTAPDRPAGVPHLESTLFHAAVGLAQLGDPLGIDWLIDNCEYSQGSVWHAWPRNPTSGSNLSACCVAALQDLAGDRSLTTKAEFKEWAKSVDRRLLTTRPVTLIESSGF